MSIHSSASVDPSARLGENVTVDPFAVIGPDVVIGDGTHVMSHTVIQHTEMGKNCKVFPQVSIGLEPQHLQYKNEKTKVVIGDNCTFREGVTVHRGTLFDEGVTRIGNNGFFMALSHIAHDCKIGNDVIMANGAQMAGHVEVGDRVFLSTILGVHQFVRIGTGAMVSGGAMVPMDVAPFCVAQGDRASIKGLNLVGMKRSGMPRESIKRIREAYRVVFQAGLKLEDALKHSALTQKDEFVKTFRDFLAKSKRGYIRPNTSNSLNKKEQALT